MAHSAEIPDNRLRLQRALLALQTMQSRLDELERKKTEPLAIIGMGCRFPGGVDSPDAFWQLLHDGVDAITEVPPDRWDIDAYYDPDPDVPGKICTRHGGFLDQIDAFDPDFFGISPRETASLDPQHRLLLEVSWEALEHAGLAPSSLAGSQTGVFVGISSNEFSQLAIGNDPEKIDSYLASGSAHSTAVGRLSYLLGLQGPCLAVDTACSSSLVTLHLACQSLRNKECDLALAAGVNLILTPFISMNHSRAHMLPLDGRCKAFDAAADGFIRSEGCGVVVLKRLPDALTAGDNILALVRGSAINHDGRTSGLTVPSGPSQQAVIRKALEQAGIEASQMSYVEAHGTGTSLGDPIEMGALGAVFGNDRPMNSPLLVGSVKTNIGHAESAAGIAGVLKVVLSLQHREIPAHLHVTTPNPLIAWDQFALRVPTKTVAWPALEGRRLAGVSSFGFGGTNAHIILEEAPESTSETQHLKLAPERPLQMLTLSAKNEQALRDLARRYQAHLSSHQEIPLADLCFTANTGRSHFSQRLSLVASTPDDMVEKLTAHLSGQNLTGVSQGEARRGEPANTVFLFTGQGSQYTGMGRELYDTQPIFRQTLNRCNEILDAYLEISLLDILYPDRPQSQISHLTSQIHQTAYTQPALFAIEYALTEVWKSWGIEPAVVMGHSVGEYVAACVAGVFSLEDGLKLIAARGRLMQALPQNGAMVAASASEARVAGVLASWAGKVSLAAINGPESVVFSGQQEAVQTVADELQREGVKCTPLHVSHAFHSALMEAMAEDFGNILSEVSFHEPVIDLVSNVSGELIEALSGSQAAHWIATPAYWIDHILKPVKFAAGIETLVRNADTVFLEIGPKPVLLGMGRQVIADAQLSSLNATSQHPTSEMLWLPSLRQGVADWQQMLRSLGQLYALGIPIDWDGFDQPYSRRKVVLPTYPFQKQRYWIEHSNLELKSAEKAEIEGQHQSEVLRLLAQGKVEHLSERLLRMGTVPDDLRESFSGVLELLARQHREEVLTHTLLQDWLYALTWEPKPGRLTVRTRQSESLFTEPGQWIILADTGGFGQILADCLAQQGQSCEVVYAGRNNNLKTGSRLIIDPTFPAGFERLFLEVRSENSLPLRGIIHLWGLDAVPSDDLTVSSLEHAQNCGCQSVLKLVQTLLKNREQTELKAALWLVTRGAVAAAEAPVSVAQAPLWGMGKVISLEHPEIWGGIVDLDPKLPDFPSEASALLQILTDSTPDDQAAFRNGRCYVPRLLKVHQTHRQTVPFQAEATYLVTGGCGALGRRVARWMAARGARYLCLTGRSGAAGQEARDLLTELKQQGVTVFAAKADVASERDMQEVFDQIAGTLPPLKGIIHAAGIPGSEGLETLSPEVMQAVLRPKVAGAWILHQLSQEMPLDFFVCFSSIASAWGSKGQAHYAAANQFLDTLCQYRARSGFAALSVNWGPWDGGGMATAEARKWLEQTGVRVLSPENAIDILDALLGSNVSQRIVANMDWNLFKDLYELKGPRPLLAKIEGTVSKPVERQSGADQPTALSNILQQLEHTDLEERPKLLMNHVQEEAAAILGLQSSKLPDPRRGFTEMGMDSLMAVELRNRLTTNLGCQLSSTLIFDYPTIQHLTDYLIKKLGWESSSPPSPGFQTEEVRLAEALSEVEGLSEDEVEASIAEELAELQNALQEK